MTNDGHAVENANHCAADYGGSLGKRATAPQPKGHCATIVYALELFDADIVGGDDSSEAMSKDNHHSVEGGGDGVRHRIHS